MWTHPFYLSVFTPYPHSLNTQDWEDSDEDDWGEGGDDWEDEGAGAGGDDGDWEDDEGGDDVSCDFLRRFFWCGKTKRSTALSTRPMS